MARDGSARGTRRDADAVRAAARLAKVAGTALGGAELTLPQYRVLVFLDRGDRPASQVAGLLDVTPSTVTSVVDGLTARGLVERRADPDDRRRVVLSLTAEGARHLQRGDDLVGERLGRLLDRLGPADAETVRSGLELLNHAMEEYLAEKFGDPAVQR
ncbi:MAG: MarR family winged helix-turn-helix transcriptional regulator [Microthrixaceae bacterium]